MTNDLVLACAAMGAVALAVFFVTGWLIASLRDWQCSLLALLLVIALFSYVNYVWYDVRLATLIPSASLVVLGNWLPLFAAGMAALLRKRIADAPFRQAVFTGGLTLAGGFALVQPILGQPPRCGNEWDRDGNCLQTTNFTCSAACAATILREHGILASEQEMAELCLTRQGTSWQGLYRGLKLKTVGTAWDVEVTKCTFEQLQQLAAEKRPMILSVGLARGQVVDSDFTKEFGWIPGVNHSVILRHYTSHGSAVIADPTQALCTEHWDEKQMQTLWRGYAVRLVKRQ